LFPSLPKSSSPPPSYYPNLFTPVHLVLQVQAVDDGDDFVQRLEPTGQLGLHEGFVVPKLLVEVLPVRGRLEGDGEDALDDKVVVWLEGDAVGVVEGLVELLGLVGLVVLEALAGEFKAAVKPEETLSRRLLLLGGLVVHEILEGTRFGWLGVKPFLEFLDISIHIADDGAERRGAQEVEDFDHAPRCLEEVIGLDSGHGGDILEGLDGVEEVGHDFGR